MTEITVEQRIAASPATVYRYLTEADLRTKWQGSKATVDARAGGLWSVIMDQGWNARGQFTELVPDSKLVFTWGWVDRPGIPPGSTEVSIDLIAEKEGTLLLLTHRNLPEDEVTPHRDGWIHYLGELANAASG